MGTKLKAEVLRATAGRFGGPKKLNGKKLEMEFPIWPVCCLD